MTSEWVAWIIHSTDLFKNVDSLGNETCEWIIETFTQPNHSTDLFKNVDSLVNETWEWIIETKLFFHSKLDSDWWQTAISNKAEFYRYMIKNPHFFFWFSLFSCSTAVGNHNYIKNCWWKKCTTVITAHLSLRWCCCQRLLGKTTDCSKIADTDFFPPLLFSFHFCLVILNFLSPLHRTELVFHKHSLHLPLFIHSACTLCSLVPFISGNSLPQKWKCFQLLLTFL